MKKLTDLIHRTQAYAKAIVAAAGTLLTAAAALSTDLGVTVIPDGWTPYITFALAVLTSYATWRVPNVPAEVQE